MTATETSPASGTVFDVGYRSYTGVREGRERSRVAIFKDGVRIALGLGRGGRPKILPWAFITILSVIGLIMAIIAGAAERIAGPGATERLNLPTHSDYNGIASIVLFVPKLDTPRIVPSGARSITWRIPNASAFTNATHPASSA